MGRVRKIVFKEGKLKQIGDLFFASLLHHRKHDIPIFTFFEYLMCADTRYVFFCAASADFHLPDGRKVIAGSRILLRHDVTMPNLFELCLLDAADPDEVFELTRNEWKGVRGAVKVTDKSPQGAASLFK
jgi:hypothetical protein